jgi:hypothetical protein
MPNWKPYVKHKPRKDTMNTTHARIIKLVGRLIAHGHGKRRGNVDSWTGVINSYGHLYRVAVRWPDSATEPEQVQCNIRKVKATRLDVWTEDEILDLY